MGASPSITIITPSYNQGQFLEQTITSVLEQGYPNLEYLIFDGGSKDNSVEIIKKYAKYLKYWVSQPDGGQSDAINQGFCRATGDILTWLNSDDYYLPGVLHKVGRYFSEHATVECIYGDLHVVDPAGNLLYVRKVFPYEYQMALYGGHVVPQPASFYRRQVVQRVGYLDTKLRYNMDTEYFVRFGQHGVNFATIHEPLACFRLHPTSKTQDIAKIAQVNFQIMARHSRFPLKQPWLQKPLFRALRFYYRAKGAGVRAIVRGDFVPFQGKQAIKTVSHSVPAR